MIKELCLIIISAFLLTNCEYSPIYNQNKNYSFTISSLEINGDSQINNFLNLRLKKYVINESKKKFNLIINTSYNKTSIAKDRSGNTTDYKLIANVNLRVFKEDDIDEEKRTNSVSFSESFILKKEQNTFEQTGYEKSIKNNLSQALLNQITFYLSKKE